MTGVTTTRDFCSVLVALCGGAGDLPPDAVASSRTGLVKSSPPGQRHAPRGCTSGEDSMACWLELVVGRTGQRAGEVRAADSVAVGLGTPVGTTGRSRSASASSKAEPGSRQGRPHAAPGCVRGNLLPPGAGRSGATGGSALASEAGERVKLSSRRVADVEAEVMTILQGST